MRYQRYLIGVLFFFILILGTLTPFVFSQTFNQDYSFQFKYGIQDQELYISVPSSLYDYYAGLGRTIKKDHDYASFVTSKVFHSLADQIRIYIGNKTRRDEQFANAVLTFIHQIRYEDNVNETKYPIETIVDAAGKCDTLSFLAASIIKAGGLDVALLYFKGVNHMTVGVHLPYEPYGTWWWQKSVGYEFENKKYWIAESTPAMDWKVGDVPPLLQGETPLIIPIENAEQSTPAQISSKIGTPLNLSSISINFLSSQNFSSSSRLIQISGSITPAQSNETVVLYLSKDGISFDTTSVKTNENGEYSIFWNSTAKGTFYARTSWWGNSRFAGADSDVVTIFLGFAKSILQFESTNYYYLYGSPGASSYELENRKGLEDFLNIQLNGSGIVLSGEVMVFSSGRLVTIPKNGPPPIDLGEILITQGMQPLRLPKDIEEKTNDQFVVIFRNDNNTYSIDLKGLDDYDLSHNGDYNQSNSLVINASSLIHENIWYNVKAIISENKVSAVITDEYGYPIKLINEITTSGSDTLDLLLILTNNLNQVVAFKDLNFKPIFENTLDDSNQESILSKIPAHFILLVVILVGVVLLTLSLKKKNYTKNQFLL